MLRAAALSVVFALALAGAPRIASAQQQQGAPDIVRLKGGAMYRGTIRELVPGQHVEILLVGGGTKRFEFAQVEYAGPDQAASGGGAPATGAGVSLAFRGDSDLTLHEVTGSSYGVVSGYRMSAVSETHSFRTLCTAPCTVALAPGTYQLAVSEGDGKPIIANRAVLPAGTYTARGDYTSRAGVRTAGYIVLVVGVVTGVGLMVYSLATPEKDCSDGICVNKIDTTPLWVGLGVAIGSSLIGTILASRPDTATVEVTPGVSGFALPKLAGLDRKEGAVLPPPGATLTVRW
jgi:hypothetical protein